MSKSSDNNNNNGDVDFNKLFLLLGEINGEVKAINTHILATNRRIDDFTHAVNQRIDDQQKSNDRRFIAIGERVESAHNKIDSITLDQRRKTKKELAVTGGTVVSGTVLVNGLIELIKHFVK